MDVCEKLKFISLLPEGEIQYILKSTKCVDKVKGLSIDHKRDVFKVVLKYFRDNRYKVLYRFFTSNDVLNIKDTVSTIVNIRKYKNYLDLKEEVCGNFDYKNNKLTSLNEVVGRRYGERGSCNYKYKTRFLWHTHPKTSKPYPSAEDILNMIYEDRMKVCFIFVHHSKLGYGMWQLSYYYPAPRHNKNYKKEINTIVNKLSLDIYRDFNLETINDFIIKIEDIYKNLSIKYIDINYSRSVDVNVF